MLINRPSPFTQVYPSVVTSGVWCIQLCFSLYSRINYPPPILGTVHCRRVCTTLLHSTLYNTIHYTALYTTLHPTLHSAVHYNTHNKIGIKTSRPRPRSWLERLKSVFAPCLIWDNVMTLNNIMTYGCHMCSWVQQNNSVHNHKPHIIMWGFF